MQYRFCWKWDDDARRPVDEMTEAEARRAWAEGPQLGVAAGEEVSDGAVPAYSLEMSPLGEDVRVHHYDAAGSIVAILDFGTIDGRLFLEEATEYLYPDDGEYHGQSGHQAMRMYFFKPDGYARLRTRVKGTEVETVEEFTDVDVASHWVEPLDWGEWDRIGRQQATGPGA